MRSPAPKGEAHAVTEPLYFRPAARLQRFLGRELIADPNLAIGEFVKNGYDAGASSVVIEFELLGQEHPSEQVIRISDDGVGMTFEEFRDNWMRPGFSEKAGRRTAHPNPDAKTARQRMEARMPIGEKGIGRLAAGRLGELLHVWTRKRRSNEWLHIPFNWDDFDDMNTPLDEIEINADYDTPPPVDWPETGTIIEISDLSLNWTGRVPGRRIAGRDSTRMGRLRQDLELILSPLEGAQQDFEIELLSDWPEHEDFTGPIAHADLRLIDYRYDFEISWDEARGVRVHSVVHRGAKFADELGVSATTSKTVYYAAGAALESDDPTSHPGALASGPITGRMYYAAQKGTGRRMQELGIQPGVRVYRDGVRVEPYGDPEDDWLGVQARKASRQGYAAIRPNHLYGFVAISKVGNHELIDMTNRQGLVENDAYDQFVAHVSAEFRRFADVVFNEFVKPEWAGDEDRARAIAERTAATVTHQDILIRDIVHELRQPVSSLGTEIRNLDYVIDHADIPEETKAELRQILERAGVHLDRIARVVREAREEPVTSELEPVSIEEVIGQAVESVEDVADATGTTIESEIDDRVVIARPVLLRRAISELLRNAIEAPRPDDATERVVRVSSATRNGNVVITVQDNGTGVDRSTADGLFDRPVSKKGRQGEGLVQVKNLLATFNARPSLTNAGERGATFEIVIPSMGEVRRNLR